MRAIERDEGEWCGGGMQAHNDGAQKGVWTMDSGLGLDEDWRDGVTQQGWAGRLEAWRAALESCRKKPSRKRVHGLRVATLRLQAELERWLAEAGTEDPADEALQRWMREACRLREALKPAREADVQLEMLAGLQNADDARRQTVPVWSRTCRQQAKEMAEHLKGQRKEAARRLAKALEARHGRLTRRCDELEMALGNAMAKRAEPTADEVSRQFARMMEEFAELSAGNLHAFRNQVKRVRYAAEQAAASDAPAPRQAACLRRIQTAAGEWHDWQALAKRARHMLGKRDAGDGLATVLEMLEGAALKKALSYCRRTTARLMRHATTEERAAPQPKKPVLRAEAKLQREQRRAG